MNKSLNAPTLLVICFSFFVAGVVLLHTLYPRTSKYFFYKSAAVIAPLIFSCEGYTDNTYGIHPLLFKKIEQVKVELREKGIDIRVTQGHRDLVQQNLLYEQGRSTSGPVVTNAKPGLSYHNYGWAVDVVVYKNGKPHWDSRHWAYIGEIGKSKGLIWGGDWKGFPDRPHFQLKVTDILPWSAS